MENFVEDAEYKLQIFPQPKIRNKATLKNVNQYVSEGNFTFPEGAVVFSKDKCSTFYSVGGGSHKSTRTWSQGESVTKITLEPDKEYDKKWYKAEFRKLNYAKRSSNINSLHGASGVTLECSNTKLKGFMFGGKFISGNSLSGLLSNEICTFQLKGQTLKGQTIEARILTKDDMHGDVPPKLYGCRLDLIKINSGVLARKKGSAILTGGITQPHSDADILSGKNIYTEECSNGVWLLEFDLDMTSFTWVKLSSLPYGLSFHLSTIISGNLFILGGLSVKDGVSSRIKTVLSINVNTWTETENTCKILRCQDTIFQGLSAGFLLNINDKRILFYGGYLDDVLPQREKNKQSNILGEIAFNDDGETFQLKSRLLSVSAAFPFLHRLDEKTLYISMSTKHCHGLITKLPPKPISCHLGDNCLVTNNLTKYLSVCHLFLFCDGKCHRLIHATCLGFTESHFKKLQQSSDKFFCKRSECSKKQIE